VEICTIGFTKHTAEQFFGSLNSAGVATLIDVRLNNSSHLAGFAKVGDLPFFLREISGIEYRHELLLAPTKELLDGYRKGGVSWHDYETAFLDLMKTRKVESKLDKSVFTKRCVLLCSEHGAERCHRRLVAEYLQQIWGGVEIVHL